MNLSIFGFADLQKQEPVYLTNGCGESIHGSPELFNVLGLEKGSLRGEFHPLSDKEREYVKDSLLQLPSGWSANTNYTVVFRGRKWHALEVEYDWEAEGMSAREVLADVQKDIRALHPGVASVGGVVRALMHAGDTHHAVSFLIPLDYITEAFATVEEYQGWLASLVE